MSKGEHTAKKISDLLLRYDARHAMDCPQRSQNYWRMRPEYRRREWGPDRPCTCGLDTLIGKTDDRKQS